MAIYTTTSKDATYMNRLHEQIATRLGGTQSDYRVEGGGTDPLYLRVETEQVSQSALNQYCDAYNTLSPNTDKATITADNTDIATITCSDAAIAADANIDYIIYDSSGIVDFSGSVAVVGGVATYEFKTGIADDYTIRFSRQGSNYNDGYVKVTAE